MTTDQLLFLWRMAAVSGWLAAASMAFTFVLSLVANRHTEKENELLGREIYRLRMALGELDEK